jgi:hypothetical protein
MIVLCGIPSCSAPERVFLAYRRVVGSAYCGIGETGNSQAAFARNKEGGFGKAGLSRVGIDGEKSASGGGRNGMDAFS